MQRIRGEWSRPADNEATRLDVIRRDLLEIAVLLGAANLLPVALVASELPASTQPMGLNDFVSLSEALTGTKGLSHELAGIYRRYLIARPGGSQELTDLCNALSSPPERVPEPGATGVFPDTSVDRMARAILKLWYTGRYEAEGVPKLAEYADTLAWHAVGYTVAPGHCGGRAGFWAEPPHDVEPRND